MGFYLATWELVLLAIAVIAFVGGVFWVWLGHGLKSREHGGIVGVVGFIVVVLILLVAFTIPAPSANIGPAPNNTNVASYVSTTAYKVAAALPSACTNYVSSATVTCTVGYNKTQGGFQLALSNTTDLGYTPGGAGTSYASLNYLNVVLHSARTDTINQTYLYTYTYQTLPTWTSISTSSTTTCSIIGFTTATATAPGTWKAMWYAGQNAGLSPTQNAPTVSTGVGADPTAIIGFGAVTQVAELSFAGGNSTSTSFGCWAGLSLYESLTVTISISQSTPPLFTLDLLPIGYNT